MFCYSYPSNNKQQGREGEKKTQKFSTIFTSQNIYELILLCRKKKSERRRARMKIEIGFLKMRNVPKKEVDHLSLTQKSDKKKAQQQTDDDDDII